jgi:hypothetical protein
MGLYDIRHYRAPDGEADMRSYPVTATQTFVAGEPVVAIAAGTLSECSSDPSAVDGIAAHGVVNGKGTTLAVGAQVTVYATSPGQTFITRRFATDGSGTAATPALTTVGDTGGLILSGGVWYLDTGAANVLCRVEGVQDVMGNNLGDPNVLAGTGVWVLFRFI